MLFRSLISLIREFRKHSGMMVALPVQKAMEIALSDNVHVSQQRARYNARREILWPALEAAGFNIEFSNSGLYIWCTRNEDAWKSIEWLALRGILATPGSFYGSAGANFVRLAMTATDINIHSAATRIRA